MTAALKENKRAHATRTRIHARLRAPAPPPHEAHTDGRRPSACSATTLQKKQERGAFPQILSYKIKAELKPAIRNRSTTLSRPPAAGLSRVGILNRFSSDSGGGSPGGQSCGDIFSVEAAHHMDSCTSVGAIV
ncbi:uncharacterized protein VTP21DRAFT_6272 [Calcarisporiella thermophila]|uniref:uncharacterized protein n=1 Tax=Calcarisporiella thermophila TaxID=911321 RepID=UPI00374394A7